jgi:hypothetical protein
LQIARRHCKYLDSAGVHDGSWGTTCHRRVIFERAFHPFSRTGRFDISGLECRRLVDRHWILRLRSEGLSCFWWAASEGYYAQGKDWHVPLCLPLTCGGIQGPIFAAKFSKSGNLLLTASLDASVCVWSVWEKRLDKQYRYHSGRSRLKHAVENALTSSPKIAVWMLTGSMKIYLQVVAPIK